MLIALDLRWTSYDIEKQVVHGNQHMRAITQRAGLEDYALYDMASIRAGEFIMSLGWKGGEVNARTIDFFRRMQDRLKRSLRKSVAYTASHQNREMLSNLRGQGHKLVAVTKGRTGELERQLKKARSLEYFEDRIFGTDATPQKKSLTDIYRKIMEESGIGPRDTMIVTDNAKNVSAAKEARPFAVVGYVNSCIGGAKLSQRERALASAKADFTAVGGMSVSAYPRLLLGYRQLLVCPTEQARRRGKWALPKNYDGSIALPV